MQTACRQILGQPKVASYIINLFPPSAAYASVNWVSNGSDNGLSPVRRQVITWISAGVLSIEP